MKMTSTPINLSRWASPWVCSFMLGLTPAISQAQDPQVFKAQLEQKHRSPENVARDSQRHPAQTLAFFGIQANSTVVEILPGSRAYYMEILAPWMRGNGRYIAADRDDSLPQYIADREKLIQRLKDQPELYDQVQVTRFRSNHHEIAPAGSADFVISFRNLHNWMERNELAESLAAFHKALKPGGVLGIVDHRGRTELSQAQQMASGYVRQDVAIALIEQNGFKLTGTTEVNANPKDSKDHPAGVWTLAPTYRLKELDRAKYQAVGESDRFTLRFVKKP